MPPNPSRRRFLATSAALAAGLSLPAPFTHATSPPPLTLSRIGKLDEFLPAIGMGTWQTFHVPEDRLSLTQLPAVLTTFFEMGGRLIDSSPMYDNAEAVLGRLLPGTKKPQTLYAATKVWTYGESAGIGQMEQSRTLWGVPRFDLMQVHNLMDWRVHLKTLTRMKAEGRVRHIGVTTSHGRRHDELEEIIRKQPVDFVQFTYNLADRDAEARLLAAAMDHGKAVIINRPFDGGALFGAVRGKPLPAFAKEVGCANWAQFFLKWIVGHPAVTCAIPATSQVAHMRENMGALLGPMPDQATRKRMQELFANIVR
ncbi:MAG: aldo/keto reductase [Betaproteobacteria bacterium]|nr:aldo/keto reductase [Betaproteobacteria bacterium]